MNDLGKLVGDSAAPADAVGLRLRTVTAISSVRELVGAPLLVSPGAERTTDTSSLKSLVEADNFSGAQTRSGDLKTPVGGSRTDSDTDALAALTALVGARDKSTEDARWQAPELARPGRRPLFGGHRKAGAVNYLSLAAAVLAVVAIVCTASFAIIQRVTANPADDAMASLREREAELANETNGLQTASNLFDASLAEAVSLAQASEPVLTALQGRVDAATLASAEAARGNLSQLRTTAASVSIPQYRRGSIDEKSLADVAKALDDVRLAHDSLSPLITEVRYARSRVAEAVSVFRSELSALGSAIRSEAEKLVAENDSAAQTFSVAVVDAATRVIAAQQAGGDGLAEMSMYAAAVDALRTENQRVLALEEVERERARAPQPPSRNPAVSGPNTGGASANPVPSPMPSEPGPPTATTGPPADIPTEGPTQPPAVIEPPVTNNTSGANS